MPFVRWLLVASLACLCSCSSCDRKPNRTSDPAPQTAATPASPVDEAEAAALGALRFEASDGTPEARQHFERGLLALHSFWYDEATREFEAAIAADPKMRMAYWGAAMSHIQLLWGKDDTEVARQLLARMPDPAGLSPREQAWVVAANQLLGTGDDVRTSRKKFVAAMEQVNTQYPDDESAAFLAIALLSATRPEDADNRAVRMHAGELAITVLAHNPKHPGALHYEIHAFDTPELAHLALHAARDYAKVAPGAFHARHMPAHIFARLGMWQDAITSCQAAWDVSVAAARAHNLSRDHDDFHSLNWLIEMSFELGHRVDADRALALYTQAVREGLGHATRVQYAVQVQSYLARTQDWKQVDSLLAPLSAPATGDGTAPHCGAAAAADHDSLPALNEALAELNTRAYAAAMQHDAVATKRFMANMDETYAKFHALMQQHQPPQAVATVEAVFMRRRAALLARAGNDDRALVAVLRESLEDADRQERGGESMQTGLLVYEELAGALVRLGQVKEAREAYDHVLETHPGRAHSLLGAARAAKQAHDDKAAIIHYRELATLWATADAGTDGLAEVRSAVGGASNVLP
jgi:tetratricopeptide (TPR) repeat protein